MKIGIAISGYNKLEEILTNINVLKKHWDIDLILSVCVNDINTYQALKSNNEIDVLTLGFDYKKEDFSLPKAWLRMRQYDTISKAILGCIDNTDYVIQWHADAYALNQNVVLDMVKTMKRENYKVAFRGKWRGLIDGKRPFGHVDDHFMMYETKSLKSCGFFNKEDLVTIKKSAGLWANEGIYGWLITKNFRNKDMWHYDDFRNNVVDDAFYPENCGKKIVDDFYPDGIGHSRIPPFNYDPNRFFLHSDLFDITRKYFKKNGIPTKFIAKDTE